MLYIIFINLFTYLSFCLFVYLRGSIDSGFKHAFRSQMAWFKSWLYHCGCVLGQFTSHFCASVWSSIRQDSSACLSHRNFIRLKETQTVSNKEKQEVGLHRWSYFLNHSLCLPCWHAGYRLRSSFPISYTSVLMGNSINSSAKEL